MSRRQLRILMVEDGVDDAALVVLELERAGVSLSVERVFTADAYRAALHRESWDVILSDYNMPAFSAIRALELLRAAGLDIPFIIISGSVAEDTAAEAMKAGAHDFFSKDNLTRLPAAIEREMKEAQLRRERRKAISELREAETRHRLVLDHIRDYAIFFLTPDRRVATWNPGAKRTLGYDQAEVVNHGLDIFCPPEAPGCLDEELDIAEERGFVHQEGWIVRQGGTRLWAERSFERIGEDGTLQGYAAIIRDVGERKRLVDDLRLAVQARDEFLSIAAHELKTPIHSLKLQLELTSRTIGALDASTNRLLSPKLSTITRQVDRLAALSMSLMDVSGLRSGAMQLRLERLDVAQAARATAERMTGDLVKAGCDLLVDTEPNAVAHLDASRLDQILVNLLSNAAKYGGGKPVRLKVGVEGECVVLSVSDGGIGIAPENLSRVFGKFERAVSSENYGGLGLGLFICRQLTEAMGGTISVSSLVEEGSTFTVRFPRARTPTRASEWGPFEGGRE